MWPLFFCQHTIHQVIWPSPGTLAALVRIERHWTLDLKSYAYLNMQIHKQKRIRIKNISTNTQHKCGAHLKAQSSKLERLFSLKRGKRDFKDLSFEIWNSIRNCPEGKAERRTYAKKRRWVKINNFFWGFLLAEASVLVCLTEICGEHETVRNNSKKLSNFKLNLSSFSQRLQCSLFSTLKSLTTRAMSSNDSRPVASPPGIITAALGGTGVYWAVSWWFQSNHSRQGPTHASGIMCKKATLVQVGLCQYDSLDPFYWRALRQGLVSEL